VSMVALGWDNSQAARGPPVSTEIEDPNASRSSAVLRYARARPDQSCCSSINAARGSLVTIVRGCPSYRVVPAARGRRIHHFGGHPRQLDEQVLQAGAIQQQRMH
jgi:hypothetical protein